MNARFFNYNHGKECRQHTYTLMFEDKDSPITDVLQILL